MGFAIRRSRDLGTTSPLPTGVINPFAGTTAPTGWLLCAGQEVEIASYGDLYGVLGTTYGALTNGSGGAGSTHFRVPDLRGRIPAGKDDMGGTAASRLTNTTITSGATTLGNSGGAQTHTLSTAEMPSHNHTQDAHNHTQNAHTHTQNAHEHEVIARGTLGGNRKWYGDYNGGAGSTHFNPNSVGTLTGPAFSNPMVGEAVTATNQNTTATNIATTATNQPTGGGGSHNNVQPTIILNYIIKA